MENNAYPQPADLFGRPLRDLRISVIDNCNFRCSYCMPAEIFGEDYVFLSPDEMLSFDEITRFARIAAELGVRKIKITGGEPLLREWLPELITNGHYLPKMAARLKSAGLDRVTVSLDSLDPGRFSHMSGRGRSIHPVLDAIEAAK